MLIRGDKDNAIFGYWSFPLPTYHHPSTGKNKYLVFPPVRMGRCGATWLEFKDAHTEAWGSIISGNNITLNYSG